MIPRRLIRGFGRMCFALRIWLPSESRGPEKPFPHLPPQFLSSFQPSLSLDTKPGVLARSLAPSFLPSFMQQRCLRTSGRGLRFGGFRRWAMSSEEALINRRGIKDPRELLPLGGGEKQPGGCLVHRAEAHPGGGGGQGGREPVPGEGSHAGPVPGWRAEASSFPPGWSPGRRWAAAPVSEGSASSLSDATGRCLPLSPHPPPALFSHIQAHFL